MGNLGLHLHLLDSVLSSVSCSEDFEDRSYVAFHTQDSSELQRGSIERAKLVSSPLQRGRRQPGPGSLFGVACLFPLPAQNTEVLLQDPRLGAALVTLFRGEKRKPQRATDFHVCFLARVRTNMMEGRGSRGAQCYFLSSDHSQAGTDSIPPENSSTSSICHTTSLSTLKCSSLDSSVPSGTPCSTACGPQKDQVYREPRDRDGCSGSLCDGVGAGPGRVTSEEGKGGASSQVKSLLPVTCLPCRVAEWGPEDQC